MKKTADWQEWSSWLREGYFISYAKNSIRFYEHVIFRDFAHWVYDWHETIEPGEESGPRVLQNLIVTKRYDEDTHLNRIWQLIFGIKSQAYIYIELPTDTHRHGIPKIPKPSPEEREISHFEEWMSDFHEPTFITEHFMMKDGYDRINFSAYNPHSIDLTDVKLNFMIAKLTTERIGKIRNGVQEPTSSRWTETLDRLYKRLIKHRPITLRPVWAPEAEE